MCVHTSRTRTHALALMEQNRRASCVALTGGCSLVGSCVISLAIVPYMIASGIRSGLVHDDPQKAADAADGESPDPTLRISPTVMTLFNCTKYAQRAIEPRYSQFMPNARVVPTEDSCFELQNVSPPPKPIFEPVHIALSQTSADFDGKSLSDGTLYQYKLWKHLIPLNPADLGLRITQVNPAYLGAVYAIAPSESLLFVGLANVILSLVYNQMLAFFGVLLLGTSDGQDLVAADAAAALGVNVSTPFDVATVQFSSAYSPSTRRRKILSAQSHR